MAFLKQIINASGYVKILRQRLKDFVRSGNFTTLLRHDLCLMVLIAAAFFSLLALLRFIDPYPLRGWMGLRDSLKSVGPVGPVVFILLTAVLPLFSPLSLLIVTGSASFGPVPGIIFSYIGSFMNANLTYFLVRELSIMDLWGKTESSARIKRVIQKNGLAIVLALQMLSVIPFVAINSAAAASGIHWKDFMGATLIGIIPPIMIYSFVGEALVSRFFPPDVYFAFISLVLILIIAMVIRKRYAHLGSKGIH